ncbi:MAG TPA: response regulator [Candidatus Limnocylindria bacterium]|nr:response regulator [Candidatus Limnocylindria bacterium]
MKKKILIIEDDPIVSHIYRSRLENDGFEVDVAADGQAGYYRLFEMKPSALVLDLMLPKLNGIDLLKKIRATREFEKLPVVVFTNAYVANMIHEALTAGASGVYNKSTITPRQIIDVLNTLLSPEHAAADATSNGSNGSSASHSANGAKNGGAALTADGKDDSSFQKELMTTFLASSGSAVSEMRKMLQEASRADEVARVAHVNVLFRKVRAFSSSAGMAGLPALAKIGGATEALVKEMMDKPKSVTPSTLRTTAQAIDSFAELSKAGLRADLADNPPIEILIVDDEVLSRRAIVYALEKAFLKATSVEDSEAALAQTHTKKFDLMFLDVNMPGMDGFQLADKLRQNGVNKTTPIVFVTGSNDFQVRAQSTLRGASDLIAKPFMFIELTVKALTFALRHRITTQREALTTATASARSTKPAENAELII